MEEGARPLECKDGFLMLYAAIFFIGLLGAAVAINFWLLETKPYDRFQQDRPARDRE